ncbi:MAG TPA: hypothetical protein PL048_24590, partial [Leptospiraceae bacterium]|nr:hypothetical protein [Leptospiraceae bacterium]
MPFKESRKVLVNSDPKYFVNSPAYSLPEVYARQILISGSYSSETFWWPILSVALFAPLKFLVPVYHYEN